MLASIAIASHKMAKSPQGVQISICTSACCASLAAVSLLACSCLESSGAFLIPPACILTGISQGLTMLSTAAFLGSCRTSKHASKFALCLCLAFAVAWLISSLSFIAANVATILLSLAGYALFLILRKSIPENIQLPCGEGASIIRTRTSVALSSQTLFGTFVGIGLCALIPNALPFALTGILIGALFTAVIQWGSKGGQLNPATVQRGTYSIQLISCVMFLAGCVLDETLWGASLAALLASFALSTLLIFNWNTLVAEMREFSLAPYPHFARGFIGIWTGCAVGLGVIAACLMMPAAIIPTAFIVAGTVLAAVMIGTAFFCKPDETEGLDALGELLFPKPQDGIAVPNGKSIDELCARTADRHGLTSREREVLAYLARGRNATFIQKELCVSFSTAKTHIYHIYQKLGISSQQQLIDLVESENA